MAWRTPSWKGAWGPNPPFHTPVFVLTHHPRPSIEMEGGTTFHFLDASPAEAVAIAREAADGQDVRLGGGPTVIRDFLAAGLVDYLHVVMVPIVLGRGVRLWEGLEDLHLELPGRGHRFAGRSHPCDTSPAQQQHPHPTVKPSRREPLTGPKPPPGHGIARAGMSSNRRSPGVAPVGR